MGGLVAATNGSAPDVRPGQSLRPFSGQAAVTLAAAGRARSRLGGAHPERSAGLGLDRWKPALPLYSLPAWPGRSACREPPGGRMGARAPQGRRGGCGAAAAARRRRRVVGGGLQAATGRPPQPAEAVPGWSARRAPFLTRSAPQQSPPRGGLGGDRNQWHGQSAAEPVPTALLLGGRMGQSKAPERSGGALRRPTGGKQLAPRAGCGSPQGWSPSTARTASSCSGGGARSAALPHVRCSASSAAPTGRRQSTPRRADRWRKQ
jgi:hypothetical protein